MRVILLTGKGGVGKTSLAVATALAPPSTAIASSCSRPIRPTASATRSAARSARSRGGRPGVTAQEVGGLDELDRSWSEIQDWLRALLRSETDELVAEELLVFPGLEELVALRAVREVEALGEYDVCVVDCAPTGSTLRMLRFPDVLRLFMENFFEIERRAARLLRPVIGRLGGGELVPQDEFFDAVERLYREIEDVRQILLDETRTSARLVAESRARGGGRDAALVRLSLALRRRDGRRAREPRAAAGGRRRLLRALGRARAAGAGRDRDLVPGADPPRAAAPGRADRSRGAAPPRARDVRRARSGGVLARGRPIRLEDARGTVLEIDLPKCRRRRSTSPSTATSCSCACATPSGASRCRRRWSAARSRRLASRAACCP